MAYQCQLCGKKAMRGNFVSHSKQRTKRFFRPHLRWSRIMVDGVLRRMKVCMDCLKKAKREIPNLKLQIPNKSQVAKSQIKIEEKKTEEVVKQKEVKVKKSSSKDLELAQKIVEESLQPSFAKASSSAKATEDKSEGKKEKPKRRGRPKKDKK